MSNQSTFDFYSKNAQSYADSTFSLNVHNIIHDFIKELNGIKILDVGCGSGRDSLVFKNLGFDVQAIEPVLELQQIAQKNSGIEVLQQSVNQIQFKQEFDGIWCMASLLHLTKDEFKQAIPKLLDALKDDGILMIALKNGIGESYDNKGRFFSYYEKNELIEIFKEFGFQKISIQESQDVMNRDNSWNNLIIHKALQYKNDLNSEKKIKAFI